MLTAPSLFGATAQKAASDLHLLVGHRPIMRVTGELFDMENEDVLTDASMEKIIRQIATPEQFERFLVSDPRARQIFYEYHRDLLDPRFWQGMQARLAAGLQEDVFPYPEEARFPR